MEYIVKQGNVYMASWLGRQTERAGPLSKSQAIPIAIQAARDPRLPWSDYRLPDAVNRYLDI